MREIGRNTVERQRNRKHGSLHHLTLVCSYSSTLFLVLAQEVQLRDVTYHKPCTIDLFTVECILLDFLEYLPIRRFTTESALGR